MELDLALQIIEYFEGFSRVPYKDTEGIWTIGKGTTIYPKTERLVDPLDPPITEAQADRLILDHIDKYCLRTGSLSIDGNGTLPSPGLSKLPGWQRMKDCQKACLISFSYNTGYDRLGTRRFDSLDYVIQKAPWKVPKVLMLYTNNQTYGLVRRRYLEGLVWMETPFSIAKHKMDLMYPV
jgi:GH24 family phage-related lysozyme (muramidase)